ncbi:MAG: hypothetical protein JWR50_1288 [Mucilaginibacter sp.]|nr:hypothetical protein [Mucilaginibacter sp.]
MMDEFKKELFEKEHLANFPKYETLNNSESQKILDDLSKKYNIDSSNFAKELAGRQSSYDSLHNDSLDGFELRVTLANIGIEPLNQIFINWNNFEDLDVFDTDDLDKYFNDIWFPVSDDINLFDKSMNWILSISHYGAISFLLNQP